MGLNKHCLVAVIPARMHRSIYSFFSTPRWSCIRCLTGIVTLTLLSIVSYSQSFEKMDAAIDSLITTRKVSGGVALVWKGGRTVHKKAYGWRDAARQEVLRIDDIFRIASQTKLIVSIAALQLIARDQISLDSPLEKWLPAFAGQMVAVKNGSAIDTMKRERSITLRHLLSHTSGISSADEWPAFAPLFQQYQLNRPLNLSYRSLEELVDQIARMPLVHQPGARFSYGSSTDVMARWIEVVSGMKLSAYLQQHIFKPLKMRDTYFKLPAGKRNRLLPVHITAPSGELVRSGNQFFPVDFPILEEITLESGAGGLVSTAPDYLRLLTCLVNGGRIGRKRSLLPQPWIDSLHTGQLGGERFTTGGIRSKNTFGLGAGITTEEGSAVTKASVGSLFWGGAFNSSYVADRNKKTITIFMFQRMPFDLPRSLSALERLAFEAVE